MTTHYQDSDYALYPKTGGLEDRDTDQGDGWQSESVLVATPHGYVRARTYQEAGYKNSFLCFIWNGRQYWRAFQKAYTARGLVTQAKRFANDVAERTKQ